MGAEIVRGCQLENISVECGHFWLNVIEKIGLLHVAALNFDRNLFEKF
jgi:hypothetical protein